MQHAEAIEPTVPVYGLNAVTGVGKTTIVRRDAIWQLLAERPNGTAIYFTVPTHALADEIAEKLRYDFRDDNITVKSYRGLTATDPKSPGNQMCRIARDADTLRRGGADIRSLCGVDRNGEKVVCKYIRECGWQKQQGPADIYVIAHNLLAHPRAKFLKPASALIVDESPIGALLTGLDGPPRSVSLYDLQTPRLVPRFEGSRATDDDATADLATAKERLFKALSAATVDEPITAISIIAAGLTSDEAFNARTLTLRCMAKISLAPDMAASARSNAVSRAKDNQRILMEKRLWESVATALHEGLDIIPGLRIEVAEKDDKQFKVARRRWREKINSDWNVPTLIMDATAQWKLVKAFWPRVDRIGTFDAAMPFVTVRQVRWSAAKSKLIGNTRTQRNNRKRIHRYIEARSAEFGSVLVICQLGLETELRALGLPNNVETAHFNGMRGLDKYKDVECLIMIGRPQAPPDQAEMQAEVLFDRVPDRGPDWNGSYYLRREVGICQRGHNGGPSLEMEYHPDPEAEVVRWSICEAELIQAIGRGRGVNRNKTNPLQIDIIGTVPLPIEVDEVLDWDLAQADPFQLMMARGVIPDCATSTRGFWNIVAAILSDLFKDKQAAQDWGRSLTMESANGIYPISESHREGMTSALVKLKGSRYKVAVLIDPQTQDPKEFAESVLGSLDFFEICEKPTSRTIDIGTPFPGDHVQGKPEHPQSPTLITFAPEPDPEPVEHTFNATLCGSPEEVYRHIVDDMGELDYLDAEAAGAEAAGRWLAAMRENASISELTYPPRDYPAVA